MKSKCWIEIKSKNFESIKHFGYYNGRLSNYLEKTIIDHSISGEEISYCRYINEELFAVIMKREKSFSSSRVTSKWEKYVAHIKDKSGFSYRNYYSNNLSDLKLKSDLYLINQGFKINFPGV